MKNSDRRERQRTAYQRSAEGRDVLIAAKKIAVLAAMALVRLPFTWDVKSLRALRDALQAAEVEVEILIEVMEKK